MITVKICFESEREKREDVPKLLLKIYNKTAEQFEEIWDIYNEEYYEQDNVGDFETYLQNSNVIFDVYEESYDLELEG
jgi:hypothetical protein